MDLAPPWVGGGPYGVLVVVVCIERLGHSGGIDVLGVVARCPSIPRLGVVGWRWGFWSKLDPSGGGLLFIVLVETM